MFERIKGILQQYTGESKKPITEGASLKEDLELDSFDIMNIIIEIEDVFGIRVEDQDAVKLLTVKNIEKMLAEKGIQ